MDERTLHEIYGLPFAIAITDAHPYSVMCAFNQINGSYACENSAVLRDYLKGELAFDGWVVDDFFGDHSTVPSLHAGLDQELVDALEPCAFCRRDLAPDQIVEIGRVLPAHRSSPYKTSAKRPRPARVRVLTVPSGIPRKSATSLCESPPQYASSITSRSFRGSVSSARWTRHDT